MEREKKSVKKAEWKIGRIVALSGALLFMTFVIYAGSAVTGGPQIRGRTTSLIMAMEAAAQACIVDNGPFPKDLNNHVFWAVISGADSGKVYMSFKTSQLNTQGEVVDSWGTPFRIWYVSAKEVGITSAGPDKTFGTADDITNQ